MPGRVLAGTPGIEVFEDVIYRPWLGTPIDEDTSWGIYGSDGALIDAAAYYWGPGKHLLGQSQRQEVTGSEAFADQTMLYGGVYIDHYGHFLLSTLARLWPFFGHDDGLPILMHGAGPAEWLRRPHVAEILGALRLSPDRLTRFTEPTRIRRLIVPRPSLIEMGHVYPAYLQTMRAIGRRLVGTFASARDGPVYLSRARLPSATQGFEDEEALEAVLTRLGVEIAYPETLSVAQAARLFATRRVVAGTIGSAFHAALFCPHPSPMVILSPSPTVNTSFPMLDQLAGHNVRYYHADCDEFGLDISRRLWRSYRLRDPVRTAGELLAAIQDASRECPE